MCRDTCSAPSRAAEVLVWGTPGWAALAAEDLVPMQAGVGLWRCWLWLRGQWRPWSLHTHCQGHSHEASAHAAEAGDGPKTSVCEVPGKSSTSRPLITNLHFPLTRQEKRCPVQWAVQPQGVASCCRTHPRQGMHLPSCLPATAAKTRSLTLQ